jgi:hypothetical protein
MEKDILTKVIHSAGSTFKHVTHDVDELAKPIRENGLKRFPVVFALLSTFGLVSILYGFESIINGIPFLHDNPLVMLFVGVGILVLTGTLYKKL